MSSSLAGYVRVAPEQVARQVLEPERGLVGVTYLGEAHVDERELDRFAIEAGHDYDFRLAALVRQLREHRTMLRRYVMAHAAAAQAGIRQLPAATQALLEAYDDARALLSEPSPKTAAESPKSGVTVSRLVANDAASSVTSRSRS
jgi:hypothetical protein